MASYKLPATTLTGLKARPSEEHVSSTAHDNIKSLSGLPTIPSTATLVGMKASPSKGHVPIKVFDLYHLL